MHSESTGELTLEVKYINDTPWCRALNEYRWQLDSVLAPVILLNMIEFNLNKNFNNLKRLIN